MKISVIVPVFNEQNFIIKTLKKINIQKENFDIEIIVVDDCSTDETNKLLNQNSELYNILIKNEINDSRNLFKKNNWPVIDVTRKSVEETAASILKIIEIKKNK